MPVPKEISKTSQTTLKKLIGRKGGLKAVAVGSKKHPITVKALAKNGWATEETVNAVEAFLQSQQLLAA